MFSAPTTCLNALRIMRSLQVPSRAVLLEGNPGVGKTSLVTALAKVTGHEVKEINIIKVNMFFLIFWFFII